MRKRSLSSYTRALFLFLSRNLPKYFPPPQRIHPPSYVLSNPPSFLRCTVSFTKAGLTFHLLINIKCTSHTPMYTVYRVGRWLRNSAISNIELGTMFGQHPIVADIVAGNMALVKAIQNVERRLMAFTCMGGLYVWRVARECMFMTLQFG